MQNTLLIFIKNPEWGKAKTRLAKTVGNDRALEIYHMLLNYTREVASQVNANKLLFYSSFVEEDNWSPTLFQKHVQSGNDLGERMLNAFQYAFEQGAEKVVIIGSDCGELTTEIIEQAFLALDNVSLVFGPAKDGGYYLLGMKRLYAFLFQNMPWSQPNLLTLSLEETRKMVIGYELLPELSDVDTEADWEQVKNWIER